LYTDPHVCAICAQAVEPFTSGRGRQRHTWDPVKRIRIRRADEERAALELQAEARKLERSALELRARARDLRDQAEALLHRSSSAAGRSSEQLELLAADGESVAYLVGEAG